MKIFFHADDAFSTDSAEFVTRRCEFAFDRFESAIHEIRVTARDENGPRGGDDIHCTIKVSLNRLADVIVHEKSSSLEAAFAAAVDRAAHQVSRRLSRHTDSIRRAAAAVG